MRLDYGLEHTGISAKVYVSDVELKRRKSRDAKLTCTVFVHIVFRDVISLGSPVPESNCG